jgi:hypothetical protein
MEKDKANVTTCQFWPDCENCGSKNDCEDYGRKGLIFDLSSIELEV